MAKKLTKEFAQKVLLDVPSDKHFYVHNGSAVKNLEELSLALQQMNEEQFAYHRNNTKNDFYNWVINVIGDIKLANEMTRTKTRLTTLKKINSRINFLKRLKGDNDGK